MWVWVLLLFLLFLSLFYWLYCCSKVAWCWLTLKKEEAYFLKGLLRGVWVETQRVHPWLFGCEASEASASEGKAGLSFRSHSFYQLCFHRKEGLPWWLSQSRVCLQCRRPTFNPWVGKIHWRKDGDPLQYSCLENSTDRGAWWATDHGVTKSWTWLRN